MGSGRMTAKAIYIGRSALLSELLGPLLCQAEGCMCGRLWKEQQDRNMGIVGRLERLHKNKADFSSIKNRTSLLLCSTPGPQA